MVCDGDGGGSIEQSITGSIRGFDLTPAYVNPTGESNALTVLPIQTMYIVISGVFANNSISQLLPGATKTLFFELLQGSYRDLRKKFPEFS